METYHFNTPDQGSSSGTMNDTGHDPRVTSLFIEDSEIVGIKHPKEKLIGWLVNGELRPSVVSVVGMGGLGKTTLVKKVYESQKVKSHFEFCVWITVSQSYKINDLLRKLMSEMYRQEQVVPQGLEAMEEVQLIETMRAYLQKKRYVVVLDDVWTIDMWECMKCALPDSNLGSRVMITTRIHNVSFHHVYDLQPLPLRDAWELFCKKAFPSNTGLPSCPPGLVELSQKIVQRCQGLPLAIVAIGGLLSKKNDNFIEWKKLNDSLGSELDRNPNLKSLTRILSLSYNDLPYYLKTCFLYLCIFPEDYLIRCRKLIRLWIAEGFVKGENDKTLEEVAEDYLDELIHRSLIQVERFSPHGKARQCRLHDLMREFLLSKSKEKNFAMVHIEQNARWFAKVQRLSVHNGGDNFPAKIPASHLRSIIVFGVDKLPTSFAWTLFSSFRLMKVLDLDGAPLKSFPEELANLFHLRYLSLRETKIETLPMSIGKLQNLETLDLKKTSVSTFPVQILKLQQLRHLVVGHQSIRYGFLDFDSISGLKVPSGIGNLRSLQKLSYVDAAQSTRTISELQKLTQLRRLGIAKLRRADGMHVCASIEKMSNLHSLNVTSINLKEFLDLESSSSPPPFLQRLCMAGPMEKLPHWISALQNLLSIRLRWTRLQDDPTKTLQALPNLVNLTLTDAYNGEKLSFMAGRFQRLRILKLNQLERLNLVIVEGGALPNLQQLFLRLCAALEMVPSGIEHLTTLKKLVLHNMPKEFKKKLVKHGDEYWRVQHIPVILHFSTSK